MQWAAFECWVTFVREKLLGHPQKKTLKVAVSRDLLTFFMKLTHLSPWETAKRVLLKDSFSRRYSEIDSAQANTARSQKIKLAEIQNWLNTAQSPKTPCVRSRRQLPRQRPPRRVPTHRWQGSLDNVAYPLIVRLHADYQHCAKSESAQANTARSFAGINFVSVGLSLPW